MQDQLTKVPPQAIEIEESILASCLLDKEQLVLALDILEPDEFYRTAHQIIFRSIGYLNYTVKQVDLPLLANKLQEDDTIEKVGGASYLAKLTDAPMATDIERYCRIVKEKASLRRTIEICNAVTKRCFNDDGEVAAVIDKFQTEINDIQIEQSNEDIKSMKDMMLEATEDLQELYKNQGMMTGIKTGYKTLDFLTCGWQPSDLIILAGRPSMGKSSLAINFALNSDVPVLIYSLEMSKRQLRDKCIAIKSGVDSHKFRSGMFSKDDWERINTAQEKLFDKLIYIDDRADINPLELKRTTRKYKQKHDIQMVIIDYIQLIGGGKGENRNLELGDITRTMKIMAKELDIPVMALSQLNRNLEMRTDKRPRLADLRESGNIEQDADVVGFVYRPEMYDLEVPWEGYSQIILSKQRNGPTGFEVCKFIKDTTRFFDVDPTLKDQPF